MTSDILILTTGARGVATLTLNRPDKHNALSRELVAALRGAAQSIDADPGIRAVVLSGAGPSFCAGGDLGWMRAQFEATREERLAEARGLAAMLGALNTLTKPLVGRVNGAAFGGGVGLIAVCDVVVTAETAQFALTETRLGLIPATIAPYLLARMGEGRARAVILSGRRFDAVEALALGLVNRVVPPDDLDAAVEAEVEPFLAAAPAAITAAKRLARTLGARIDTEIIENTAARLADTWETDSARDGITAFFERRPPPWAG